MIRTRIDGLGHGPERYSVRCPQPRVHVLALCVVLSGQGARAAQDCEISTEWASTSSTLSLSYDFLQGTGVGVPMCDPIILTAQGAHDVHLDLTCSGCRDTANRFIENETNIEYRFAVRPGTSPFPGTLHHLANDVGGGAGSLDAQRALFHIPEDLPLNQPSLYIVDVYASSLDVGAIPPKPPTFNRVGDYQISVSRRNVEDLPGSAGGVSIRRVRELNDITISVNQDTQSSPPGIEVPAVECLPAFTWQVGDPIAGQIVVGDPASPLSALLEGDVVLIHAEASDVDDIELRCESLRGCTAADLPEEFPDTLRFAWTVSAGRIIGSASGRTIAYEAPAAPSGDVEVRCTVTDTGRQFTDPPTALAPVTLAVLPHRERIQAAMLSVVAFGDAPSGVALADTTPPHYPGLSLRRLPKSWGTAWTFFDPQQSASWRIIRPDGSALGFSEQFIGKHPWTDAFTKLAWMHNPTLAQMPALSTFDDFEALRALREFRHMLVVECTAIGRRDVVREILIQGTQGTGDAMRAIYDVGWAPNAPVFADPVERLQATQAGRSRVAFARGREVAGARSLLVYGEYRRYASVVLSDKYRIADGDLALHPYYTNREVEPLEPELTLIAESLGTRIRGDAVSAVDYPRRWLFVGAGGGAGMTRSANVPGIPVQEYIDRGKKVDKEGV